MALIAKFARLANDSNVTGLVTALTAEVCYVLQFANLTYAVR